MKLTEAKLKELINLKFLEEGMKTIDDLPEGVFIKIDGDVEDVIDIYYADKEGRPIKFKIPQCPMDTFRWMRKFKWQMIFLASMLS